jgi:thiol-disulfide isomerase/thioredoxin
MILQTISAVNSLYVSYAHRKKKLTQMTTRLIIYFTLLSYAIASSQSRVVLIEQFTNSGCPPCAAATPILLNYIENNPQNVVAIAYHTSFPYSDSMNFENPVESAQRVNYYGVQGVPYTVMDGNVFSGTTASFNSSNSTQINARAAIKAPYDISMSSLNLTGNQLSGSFVFTPQTASNANTNLRAHLVIIEKKVLKSAYAASPGANEETQYGFVMRKMIGGSAGSILTNKTLNGQDSLTLNWTISKIKDTKEIRVVAFVQNDDTKEVYQARIFTPSIFVGVKEQAMLHSNAWEIFPNPSSGAIYLSFEENSNNESISIVNQLGETVYQQSLANSDRLVKINTQLIGGIYIVRVSSEANTSTKKLVVVRD